MTYCPGYKESKPCPLRFRCSLFDEFWKKFENRELTAKNISWDAPFTTKAKETTCKFYVQENTKN